jgi:high-affinity nickel-transport protein
VAVGFGARSAGSSLFSTVQTSASGLFLYLIAGLNLVALVRLRRAGDGDSLDRALASRGLLARLVARLTRSIRHPAQMYPVGVLFGVGFDTATEIMLLALAGMGAVGGVPWLALLVLPVLFAAGMTLFDTLDGVLMTAAYRWAFDSPARKIYYNLTVTGLSVAVALVIGTIELVGVLRSKLDWTDPVSGWIASVGLNGVGFVLVGLFVLVWGASLAYWRLGRVEQRWALTESENAL